MRLNTIKSADGSRSSRKRVGRGTGSGIGKTAGRGVKGQKSRSGGFHKTGFEGGQMPLQRRLPKRGFRSRVNRHTAEIRLSEINSMSAEIIDLDSLREECVVANHIDKAKVILSGELSRAVTVKGLGVTKGARAAIESAGGKIEE